jgi:hypothetical protein
MPIGEKTAKLHSGWTLNVNVVDLNLHRMSAKDDGMKSDTDKTYLTRRRKLEVGAFACGFFYSLVIFSSVDITYVLTYVIRRGTRNDHIKCH